MTDHKKSTLQGATPPRIAPAEWEDHPAFRETFLVYFTEPPANAALRIVGRLFHELVLEYYHQWPAWTESITATELRSALADLRHLEGYLEAVGREREAADLADHDTTLSRLAGRLSRELARVADEIESAVGTREV